MVSLNGAPLRPFLVQKKEKNTLDGQNSVDWLICSSVFGKSKFLTLFLFVVYCFLNDLSLNLLHRANNFLLMASTF